MSLICTIYSWEWSVKLRVYWLTDLLSVTCRVFYSADTTAETVVYQKAADKLNIWQPYTANTIINTNIENVGCLLNNMFGKQPFFG